MKNTVHEKENLERQTQCLLKTCSLITSKRMYPVNSAVTCRLYANHDSWSPAKHIDSWCEIRGI